VAEPGSDMLRDAMSRADGWFMCRIGYVETIRAVSLSAGRRAAEPIRREWAAFGVVDVDQRLAEEAAELAIQHDLRSLDALHLAAARLLPDDELVLATWDRRLHAAAASDGLPMLPATLD
jgi:uncharacterized protein